MGAFSPLPIHERVTQESHSTSDCFNAKALFESLLCHFIWGYKNRIANRSDHGGHRRARNHSAAEIAGFFASPAAKKKSLAASDFGGVSLKIARSSQRPRPQVTAAARFRGRSDHGTLRSLLKSYLSHLGVNLSGVPPMEPYCETKQVQIGENRSGPPGKIGPNR